MGNDKKGWYWVRRYDGDVWLIGHTTDGVDFFINGNYVGLVYEIGERILTNDELVAIKSDLKSTKIDWDKAPEWANYYAVDLDGTGFFYEKKPIAEGKSWRTKSGVGCEAKIDQLNWKETLQERPKKEWWETISEDKPVLVRDDTGFVTMFDKVPPKEQVGAWMPLSDEEIDALKLGF